MNKKSFEIVEKEYNDLWYQEKYNAAALVIENALSDYPEKINEMYLDLAALYLKVGKSEKTLEILDLQLDKGIWYPKEYFGEVWEKDEFKELVQKWNKISEKAKVNSKAEYIIRTPKNYTPNKEYPLFAAVHGWGEDIKMFGEFWNSPKLEEEYIVVMPQSSQMLGYKNYGWDNNELAHKEIKEVFDRVVKEYSIDTKNIVIGGFSQGATMSIDIALNHEYISARGFIALNPDKPKGFRKENIIKAKKNEKKGFIITGDKDTCYDEQKEIMETFKELDFQCEISVKENFGHWFPEDLPEKIDYALDLILK